MSYQTGLIPRRQIPTWVIILGFILCGILFPWEAQPQETDSAWIRAGADDIRCPLWPNCDAFPAAWHRGECIPSRVAFDWAAMQAQADFEGCYTAEYQPATTPWRTVNAVASNTPLAPSAAADSFWAHHRVGPDYVRLQKIGTEMAAYGGDAKNRTLIIGIVRDVPDSAEFVVSNPDGSTAWQYHVGRPPAIGDTVRVDAAATWRIWEYYLARRNDVIVVGE